MSFDCVRAAFRSARKVDASAMIFELARVEIGWTNQSPASIGGEIGEGEIVLPDEQFHHNTQMHALASFKAAAWNLPTDAKDQLSAAWEVQFDMLFDRLGCANTRQFVEQVIHPIKIMPRLEDYLVNQNMVESAKDLAD